MRLHGEKSEWHFQDPHTVRDETAAARPSPEAAGFANWNLNVLGCLPCSAKEVRAQRIVSCPSQSRHKTSYGKESHCFVKKSP